MLVIDDERSIRVLIRDVLSDDYEVLIAAGGDDAMRVFEQHGDEIAAVITDVRMPGIDGGQLVEWLKERAAHLPIIMMSGHTGSVPVEHLLRQPNMAWLPKPFDIDELTALLKNLMQ